MKKIGKQVLYLPIGESNPRNGEGDFIRLKDGRIMYAFTEYCGDCQKDHGVARITAVYSSDEGETWSDREILIQKDDDAQNIMSVNLLRLKSGELGIIYLRKSEMDKRFICMPLFRKSKDEGKTWSDITYCTTVPGYYCPFNGSKLVTKSGRIYLPVCHHLKSHDSLKLGIGNLLPDIGPCCQLLYSDDDGKTWNTHEHIFRDNVMENSQLTEPAMYEFENGDLWMWFRTPYGHQYQSFSTDGGKTWSDVFPNLFFMSPDAPMQIERAGKYTVAVFNPIPYHHDNERTEYWGAPKRTPFALAVSEDDGKSLAKNLVHADRGNLLELKNNHLYLLEDDYSTSYCYPSIFAGKDYILVGYYHSGQERSCLSNGKIMKINFSEF